MALRESDKIEAYSKISKNIDVEIILQQYPNLPLENLDMFFATNMHDVTEKIKKGLMGATYGFEGAKEVGMSSLRILKSEILDKTKYYYRNKKEFNKRIIENNSQYGYDKSYENPFYVSDSVFESQFRNLDEDSDIQIYAKTLYWSNKAVRDVNVVREKVVSNISESKKATDQLINFESQCKLKIVGSENRKNLRDSYISEYKKYLAGETTKEQLEKSEVYVKMGKMLEKQQKYGLQISPEDAYTFLSLSTSRRNLYLLKDTYIEEIVSSYSKLQQSKQEDNELSVFHMVDDKIKGKLNTNANKELLTILVKDTNAPICVHASSAFFNDMRDVYEVDIPQGESKLDYRNLIYIKYSDEQKEEIERLNNKEDKSLMDFNVRDFIENQHNMCTDLDKVKILKYEKQR